MSTPGTDTLRTPLPPPGERPHERVLPPPQTHGGMALADALSLRRSTREYADRPIAIQQLSNLLWAAYGINRVDSGDRTAPYWRHIMVLDVFVAMADGVWRYWPERHQLQPYLADDIRDCTGLQDFAATAPVELIYVAHGERMHELGATDRRLYASVDAAFIGQNVYLYCAANGLGSVFRGALDYPRLGYALHLPPDDFVTFAQTVGYPRHSPAS